MMVPNGVYGKPDLCVDWFKGDVLTQPLARARLGAYYMSSKWFIKWQVLSSCTIKYVQVNLNL